VEHRLSPLTRYQLLEHSKKLILNALKEAGKNVFTYNDLSEILKLNREKWRLAGVTRKSDFIEFIVEKKMLKEIEIKLINKITNRYILKNATNYEIALSLRKDSYLSHYSAMFVHGLTDNVIKNIYTNLEQSKKPKRDSSLTQERIDMAYSRPMRMTRNIAKFSQIEAYLLNGKNLNRLEVIEYPYNDIILPMTSMERTLIDIAIRPNYSGGVNEVLNAYQMAKGRFSANRLVATLKAMNYIYPYHQVIGFYLERTGYKKELIRLLEKIPINYKFYLTYQIKNKDYSKKWNLYFPKGL
jgi:predicted transcriptional regulator of viral defense system